MRFKVEYKQERHTAPPAMPAAIKSELLSQPQLVEIPKVWTEYFPATSISEALAKAESYNTSGYARVISIREAP